MGGSRFCLWIPVAHVLWGPVPGHPLVLQSWCSRGLEQFWFRQGPDITVTCIWIHIPHSKTVCKDQDHGKMQHRPVFSHKALGKAGPKKSHVTCGLGQLLAFLLPLPLKVHWSVSWANRGAKCVSSDLPSVHWAPFFPQNFMGL